MKDHTLEGQSAYPLELFFDLVFVYAISQLSHHLLADLRWHTLAETSVLLVGVYGVWAYTSFEATLHNEKQKHVQMIMLVVMAIGLFMNAAITNAFKDAPFAFIVPMLIIRFGRTLLFTIPLASSDIKKHFIVMLGWVILSSPIWIVGALTDPQTRLYWWSVAAVIDLIGTWTGHRTPDKNISSEKTKFDAQHMLERMRLFLIIALGEVVLLTGAAVNEGEMTHDVLITSGFSLLMIIALWALYFDGSEHFISEHFDKIDDQLKASHQAVNGLIIAVIGLIAIAVASKEAIAHPHQSFSILLSVLLIGGTIAYLLVQIWYLYVISGNIPRYRVIAIFAVCAIGFIAPYISAMISMGILASVLAVLWTLAIYKNSKKIE